MAKECVCVKLWNETDCVRKQNNNNKKDGNWQIWEIENVKRVTQKHKRYNWNIEMKPNKN